MSEHSRNIEKLRKRTSQEWSAIANAAKNSRASRLLCREAALHEAKDAPLARGDADLVVFGSIARDETTSGSDVDWTLLIDGEAKSEHREIARTIDAAFKERKGLKTPGNSGIFGSLAFSHDIIHHIGGQDDTNPNMTQRILLLLESKAISLKKCSDADEDSQGPHSRVVKEVLDRYLTDESTSFSREGQHGPVPRFLLNDIVRFWRTMCVDFAHKEWTQQNQKWAIRNIKLRMSRKLLFVSGLLMCFRIYSRNGLPDNIRKMDKEERNGLVQNLLTSLVVRSPLDILCEDMDDLCTDDTIIKTIGAYDSFLEILDDKKKREKLETVKPAKAHKDELYQEAYDHSVKFQEGLDALFFESNGHLPEFIKRYGVF